MACIPVVSPQLQQKIALSKITGANAPELEAAVFDNVPALAETE